jgi:hypothetical protein
MSGSFAEVITNVRDLSRCLIDSGKLKFPVPVSVVRELVARNLAVKKGHPFDIEVECRAWKGLEFRSVVFRYARSAKIIHSKTLNPCWRRFSICKELAHIDSDQEEDFTTAYSAFAPYLVADAAFISDAIPSDLVRPVLSEQLAYFFALETLLPWELRDQLVKMRDNGKSDFEIATFCKVPEQIVALALHSSYTEASARLNKRYDELIGPDWSGTGLPIPKT